MSSPEFSSVLVVGGCGFLGHHLVKGLLEDLDKPTVSVLDLDVSKNVHDRVKYFKGDISSPEDVKLVLNTVKPTVIFHTASIIAGHTSSIPDDVSKFKKVNIEGTANLLARAKESTSVVAFVYTSSVAVLVSKNSYMDDETAPVLDKIDNSNPYDGTKAIAESLVLAANNRKPPNEGGLRTCSLRLAGIHGPGDLHVMGIALEKIPRNETRTQIGDESALSDFIYVGNAVYAHILASKALIAVNEGSEIEKKVDGEAFFITDDDPMSFWEFSRRIWAVAGHIQKPEDAQVIPAGLLMFVAGVLEWVFWIVTFGRRQPVVLRRSVIAWCCWSRTYNISKAKERLGYTPRFSTAEALKVGVEWGLKYLAELDRDKKNV